VVAARRRTRRAVQHQQRRRRELRRTWTGPVGLPQPSQSFGTIHHDHCCCRHPHPHHHRLPNLLCHTRLCHRHLRRCRTGASTPRAVVRASRVGPSLCVQSHTTSADAPARVLQPPSSWLTLTQMVPGGTPSAVLVHRPSKKEQRRRRRRAADRARRRPPARQSATGTAAVDTATRPVIAVAAEATADAAAGTTAAANASLALAPAAGAVSVGGASLTSLTAEQTAGMDTTHLLRYRWPSPV
jgi:hypothetical protein